MTKQLSDTQGHAAKHSRPTGTADAKSVDFRFSTGVNTRMEELALAIRKSPVPEDPRWDHMGEQGAKEKNRLPDFIHSCAVGNEGTVVEAVSTVAHIVEETLMSKRATGDAKAMDAYRAFLTELRRGEVRDCSVGTLTMPKQYAGRKTTADAKSVKFQFSTGVNTRMQELARTIDRLPISDEREAKENSRLSAYIRDCAAGDKVTFTEALFRVAAIVEGAVKTIEGTGDARLKTDFRAFVSELDHGEVRDCSVGTVTLPQQLGR
jgi:hypothetical protein